MTELATSRPVVDAANAQSVVQAQAVITEEQVRFSTAAAVAPVKHRRFGAALHVVRAAFAGPKQSRPQKHYPQRLAFLEHGSMAREMQRL